MLGDFYKSPYHPNLNIFPPDHPPFPRFFGTSLSRPLLTLFSWEAIRGLKKSWNPTNWVSPTRLDKSSCDILCHTFHFCCVFVHVASCQKQTNKQTQQTNKPNKQTNKQTNPTNPTNNQPNKQTNQPTKPNKTKQNKKLTRPCLGLFLPFIPSTPNPNPSDTFSRVKLWKEWHPSAQVSPVREGV